MSGHQRHPEQLIYASESYSSEAYDYWKAVEKYNWMIGDFVWTSFDYIGKQALVGMDIIWNKVFIHGIWLIAGILICVV